MLRFPRVPAWAVLATLVAISTLLRAVAAWGVGSPWIAPDEMIYALLGRSLWEDGRLSILGADTGFYSLLYPALVGLPFATLDVDSAHRVVQVVQALVVSSTAIPVYLWGRTLARPRWALVAAVLVLALPGLGYSALVMSETLFLPLVTLALWALARALERPTAFRQALLVLAVLAACATRLQAVVLVPTLVAAVLVKAALDRDRGIVRRLAPLLGLLAGLGVLSVLAGRDRALGAYAAVGDGGYDASQIARFIAAHAAGVLIVCGIVPAVALALVVTDVARAREPVDAVRAFVAVAAAYVPLLVLEVGVFASTEVGHLTGRNLITTAPLALLGLGVWLDRGAPRRQPVAALVVLLAGALLLALPEPRTVTAETIHDTLALVWLEQIAEPRRELVFAVVVGISLAAVAFVPRRARLALAATTFAALGLASVTASLEAVEQSEFRSEALLGGSPGWVDAAGRKEVVFLYAGEPRSTIAWQHVYANGSITDVWALTGLFVPGPLPQRAVYPGSDGSLARKGAGAARPVVAPTSVTLFGTPLAQVSLQDTVDAGLVLWQTVGPPRLSTTTSGVLANGDFSNVATLTAFDCGSGRLELTLLGKSGNPVELRLDGITRQVAEVASGAVWRGAVESQAYASEDGICEFELVSEGLVGSTRLEFVRS
ncbi:MAG TPA: glycosyltransferase family 39 protein [Gaiellaceae bacterium]|nr:glycosyltransferase family 39 protein [Gaiellaceae bacterium]